MILILSETYDKITDKVCEYLCYYKKPFVRINQDNCNSIYKVHIETSYIDVLFKDINGKIYSLKDFNVFWNRRGYFNTSFSLESIEFCNDIKHKISQHLINEATDLFNFVYEYFKDSKCINNPLLYNVNKLVVLKNAIEIGIDVPPTLITNSGSEIIKTSKLWGSLITKNISNGINYINNGVTITQGTEPIKTINVNKSDTFFYSLVQKHIRKKYELRIFFIGDKYFSGAIFSQQNEKTKYDFRNYDSNKENLIVPCKIPKYIKQKLQSLMKKLNLNCGSIDMIVTPKNEYIFLEVNPVGQLEWLSYFCNFNIEKEIARFLFQ